MKKISMDENNVIAWSEVLKKHSKEMIWTILNMVCSWKNAERFNTYFENKQAQMLLYTPLNQYKNTDLYEYQKRWVYILRSVR